MPDEYKLFSSYFYIIWEVIWVTYSFSFLLQSVLMIAMVMLMETTNPATLVKDLSHAVIMAWWKKIVRRAILTDPCIGTILKRSACLNPVHVIKNIHLTKIFALDNERSCVVCRKFSFILFLSEIKTISIFIFSPFATNLWTEWRIQCWI